MGWSDTTRDPEDTGAGLPRKTSEQIHTASVWTEYL